MTPLAFKAAPLVLMAYGTRAAKSGDPLKYFFRTADKGIFNNTRLAQRSVLATLGNMEARMRQGFVPDATATPAAVADAMMGHVPTMVGGVLRDARSSPHFFDRTVTNRVLQTSINDNGTFNIAGVENALNTAKAAHDFTEGVRSLPLVPMGAGIGGAIGYAVGDEDHKLRSVLKGGLRGGLAGYAVRSQANSLAEAPLYQALPGLHKEYFASPYWRSQLEHANNWRHQKIGRHMAELLTDLPEKRFARIQTSDASLALNDDILSMDKWKDFVNKAKTSFQSPEAIRKAYSLPTPAIQPRGSSWTERVTDRIFGAD